MQESFNKVPEVTLAFWVIKILATTLGETGGDTVTMTLDWGYVAGVILFGVALVVLVARKSSPRVSTRACTGRPSWPRRRSAPRSPTSRTDRWASATPAD